MLASPSSDANCFGLIGGIRGARFFQLGIEKKLDAKGNQCQPNANKYIFDHRTITAFWQRNVRRTITVVIASAFLSAPRAGIFAPLVTHCTRFILNLRRENAGELFQ